MVGRAGLLLVLWLSVGGARLHAASALWNLNPANGDWNMALNWSSMAVPNGPADVATFGLSTITSVFLSADTEVESIVFDTGASAYTITSRPTRTLTVSGAGIVNNSGMTQSLVAAGSDSTGLFGSIGFVHSATIGSSTSLISNGSSVANVNGGLITFHDSATAGAGTLLANGGAVAAGNGGRISFYDLSSAGDAALSVNGGAVPLSVWATINFFNNSTAAHATITTNGGVLGSLGDVGGRLIFHDGASAAQAQIINQGGRVTNAGGGETGFLDTSSAGTATIINERGEAQAFGGSTNFGGDASAANSLIVNNGGGRTLFLGNSTASAAHLIANDTPSQGSLAGGYVSFEENSSGGTARVEVFGNGFVNIRQHNAPGLTVGSLEGTGTVFLGNNNLSIGSNNLSTQFSGVIRDGGPSTPGPTGGSISKVGTGALVLAGQNTYTGQTTVTEGKLVIDGSVFTPVAVNGGILAGAGTTGAISINTGGTLSPGDGSGILSVSGNLSLALGATYLVRINGATVATQYSQTLVTGTVALGNATLTLALGFLPDPGTTFTIIGNDGTDPIKDVFAGLSEGAIFATNAQNFRISYQGGSGNDIVLTAVVPEPRTWLLGATGGCLLLLRCRRIS